MSKPYPCCCRCVHCPQYDLTDDWTFDLANIGGPGLGVVLTSSSTGNPLHVDLNNLLHPPFNFSLPPGGTSTKQYLWYSGNLFPGQNWVYNGSTNVNSVELVLAVHDNCSKVWIAQALLRAFTGLGITIIGGTAFVGGPPAAPNCGAVLTKNFNIGSSFIGNGTAGDITLTPP